MNRLYCDTIVHETVDIFWGHAEAFNPFLHILGEFVIFDIGGAVAFALATEVRNRLTRN